MNSRDRYQSQHTQGLITAFIQPVLKHHKASTLIDLKTELALYWQDHLASRAQPGHFKYKYLHSLTEQLSPVWAWADLSVEL